MDPDEPEEEEGPLYAWLPPDDRLWRHPSEANTVPIPTLAAARPQGDRGPVTRTWAVAVVAGVVGAVLASGIGVATGAFRHPVTVVQPITRVMASNTAVPASATSASQDSVATSPPVTSWQTGQANAVAPSIVVVNSSTPSGSADGSGVLYAFVKNTDRTYLLTDADLVSGGGHIRVTFNDGSVADAHLVGTDAETGLALLWVSHTNHPIPQLGSVADLRVAQEVLAVGATSNSVIGGQISALDQEVDSATGVSMTGLVSVAASLPFTEAAGAALVDQSGQVVGIATDVTSTDPDDQGLSYAVTIDEAAHIANQLMAGQTPTHPWLGVSDTTDLSTQTARELDVTGGAEVQSIIPDSPASAAGVAADDVIVSFDGQSVASAGTLSKLVEGCQPGSREPITYIHRGQRITTTIEIQNQPEQLAS